ncbi:MAG TPA: PEP-CTERM sorting domain-containing protein [Pirellulaceae bacterium]|nr:PEP-CTERM sorting domain-containing protein [Pirellulaceae bacterium]
MSMRKIFGVIGAIAIAMWCAQAVNADVLWDNGPFITHPGGMTGAAAGADRSAISPGGSLFGTGGAGPTLRLADDFQLTAPLSIIDSFTFYAYTTGAGAPTATGLTLRIWSGTPGTGTVIWGDTTTNVMTSTGWLDGPSGLGVFRTTAADTAGNTRRIQFLTAGGLNINLGPGTYWVDFNYTGTNFTPVLSSTVDVVPGNAIQSQDGGLTYPFNILDGPTVQTGLPFLVNGVAIPEPTMIAPLLGLFGMGLVARRRRK